MEKQFKTPILTKKKGFDKVKKALKKFLAELTPEQQEQPLTFFYHSNYEYNDEVQPIMYLSTEAVSNAWAKWFKLEKQSKEFATGICSFDKNTKVLTLEIQLGKGGKDETKKVIEKVLLKPFATITIVDKLEMGAPQPEPIVSDGSESTAESEEAITSTVSDYENEQLPIYLKEAKQHVSNILANQKELSTIIETLEPQLKKMSAIIITNDLIEYSKKALTTFGQIDISDIKQSLKAFKSLIPKKLIKENAELDTELNKLDKLTSNLGKLKPKISKLSKKCLKIQKVGNPMESAAAPISTNPFENFGTRLNKTIQSSILNRI